MADPTPPKIDPKAAARFVWEPGDIVIVRRGDDQNSAVAKAVRNRPLDEAALRLAEQVDERRLAGEEQE